ncbi:MAG: hypothetical protein ACRC3I_04890, partial [Cetobacterium sp.]
STHQRWHIQHTISNHVSAGLGPLKATGERQHLSPLVYAPHPLAALANDNGDLLLFLHHTLLAVLGYEGNVNMLSNAALPSGYG